MSGMEAILDKVITVEQHTGRKCDYCREIKDVVRLALVFDYTLAKMLFSLCEDCLKEALDVLHRKIEEDKSHDNK